MSTKTVETSIRDLTKTVSNLQSEIVSLKKLVLDQSNLIKVLISGKDSSSEITDEGRNGLLTSDRPPRSARVRAASAISEASRTNKRDRNILPALARSPRPETTGTLALPEPARVATSHSAPPTPTATAPGMQQVVPVSMTHASAQLSSAPTEVNKDAAEWIEVKYKHSRRSAPVNVTRGTAAPGSTACTLAAAERKSYLHLFYVKCGTTSEEVSEHLHKICPGDKCSVEALNPKGDYASFKLTIPTKHIDQYLSPEHWAEDVCIKPWRSGFRKPQQTQKN